MENAISTSLRRLPVYVLIDCSGSMSGEPIAALEMGFRSLMADLTSDPQSLDTVWLSVITFASTAEQLVPLTDIVDFDPPHLEAGGTTALGEAIELLTERLLAEVRPTTPEQKGDWKPMVYVLTDGSPTDDWEGPVDDFRSRELASVIACGAGPEVDEGVLKRLGQTVIRLHDTQPGTLGAFMKWVTMSVNTVSRSVGTRATLNEMLPDLPEERGIRLVP